MRLSLWFTVRIGQIRLCQIAVVFCFNDTPTTDIYTFPYTTLFRSTHSRLNLIRLLPRLTELLLYDNSREADPRTGTAPEPGLVLRLVQGKVRETCELTRVPEWAKPDRKSTRLNSSH